MKIQNPRIKTFFCSLIAAISFLIIASVSTKDYPSFNNTIGIIIGVPIVFIVIFFYCSLIIFLEHVKVIVPNFLYRFSIPFSACCLVSVIYSIYNKEPIIEEFQQFSFIEYWLELSTPFLVLLTINLLIAGIFSIGNE